MPAATPPPPSTSGAMLERLEALHRQAVITDLDLYFTRFIRDQAGGDAPQTLLAACVVSHWTGNGNVCVNLYGLADEPIFEPPDGGAPLRAPAADAWIEALRNSSVVGRPGDYRPLILDNRGRLYLYRYWDYERRLENNLRRRAQSAVEAVDEARLREDLARLFPPSGHSPDWQKLAAACAALKPFCVISGGPGTGKTTTVLRILALLIGQRPHSPPSIGLAAPTGKAAARMQEAIRAAKRRLELDPLIGAAIPEQASTLHRLLGSRADSVDFRHGPEQPLPLEILVVDEASMVDLALMSKLVEALSPKARLILLGDKDQLASVEAGAVLGDICGFAAGFSAAFGQRLQRLTGEAVAGAGDVPPLSDAIVLLRHSYRFGSDSGIGRLARAINQGYAETAREVLLDGAYPDARWRDVEASAALYGQLGDQVASGLAAYFRALRQAEGVDQAGGLQALFTAFERFRVLCALRTGPFGAEELNRVIERALHERRLLRVRGPWYAGRPVMIRRNDYQLRLYNGDVGLTLADRQGQLRVYFQSADGGTRSLPPRRLPEHETVYAMTVHKSQGSEFDHVLLLLPNETSRILSRELLYTGLSRARQSVEIWGREAVFSAAVNRRVQRSSGLRDALWS